MQSIKEVLDKSTAFLERHGVPNANLDAQLLMASQLNCKRLELFLRFEEPLTEPLLSNLREAVIRRSKREPLQQILGNAPFMDFFVKVTPDVLTPRPETETFIELITNQLKTRNQSPKSILDLGTGSGVIAIALARIFPEAKVTAVDQSPAALAIAQENAQANNASHIHFTQSNWFINIDPSERFDLIVSNPPYLTKQEWTTAQPEVKDHEPKSALVAEDSGLLDIKTILQAAPNFASESTLLAFETGIAQHQAIQEFTQSLPNYSNFQSHKDLNNLERFIFLDIS